MSEEEVAFGMRIDTFLASDPIKPYYIYDKEITHQDLQRQIDEMNNAALAEGTFSEDFARICNA